ncbi:hypothetical protein Bca4012_009156 [Brassica carinata]|uniref:Uncharacterized protein n=1 Tax=Brassica carinata TaxID=52824 RepID=A0A8X7RZW5_BRACI|nr:hypothetical protein Bca52824_034436 [Brassica carinata]
MFPRNDITKARPKTGMKQQWLFLFLILCLFVLFRMVDAPHRRLLRNDQSKAAQLTAFKQTSVKSDPSNFLSSWTYGSGRDDPCS